MASKNRPKIKPATQPVLSKRVLKIESDTYQCVNCGIDSKKRVQKNNKYCSNSCQKDYMYYQYINNWLNNIVTGVKADGVLSGHIRRHLRALSNNKCSVCGWGEPNPVNGIVPLEIDHIDGNRENNKPSNLRVLCPNCHSLTPTYRVLNKSK